VAADGDRIFLTFAGTGRVTATGNVSSFAFTITGGTGRFADASGTLTAQLTGETIALVGLTQTDRDAPGRISYQRGAPRRSVVQGDGAAR
jgi:hypothetical protein